VKDVIQSTARLRFISSLASLYTEQDRSSSLAEPCLYDTAVVKGVPGASSANSAGECTRSRRFPRSPEPTFAMPSRERSETNEPQVQFYLTSAAGNHFADFTAANKGKPLAIVLDNKIYESRISTTQFAIRELSPVAALLSRWRRISHAARTGALPASIRYCRRVRSGRRCATRFGQGVLASVMAC